MAKIARLSTNVKVAQKLRSATSQFPGGTTYHPAQPLCRHSQQTYLLLCQNQAASE